LGNDAQFSRYTGSCEWNRHAHGCVWRRLLLRLHESRKRVSSVLCCPEPAEPRHCARVACASRMVRWRASPSSRSNTSSALLAYRIVANVVMTLWLEVAGFMMVV